MTSSCNYNKDTLTVLTGLGKTGILGGTFDPIHNGHMALAATAYSELKLDAVLFLPAYCPPHKEHFSSFADRLTMTELATAPFPHYLASDFEGRTRGPSFTYDTLLQLHQDIPQCPELFFIIGADSQADIQSWHHCKRLLDLANIVIVNRPGYPVDPQIFTQKLVSTHSKYQIINLAMPACEISATQIRHQWSTGETISELVPQPIVGYMNTNCNYSAQLNIPKAKP